MVVTAYAKAHNPTTKHGLKRIKKTFLASGPAAARNPLPRRKTRAAKYSGWRFGSLIACFEVGICLTINVLFTAFAVTTSNPPNGIGTLYEGSCETVKNLDTWLHVVLNGLATALIGASNYNMQCLASPNRQEVDQAHAKGIWLDIGVPSVRNLRHIAGKRLLLWALLATSSLPLHLLWNSAIFSTLQTNESLVFTVLDDFLLDGTHMCGESSPEEYQDYAAIICYMYTAALEGTDSNNSLTRLDYLGCVRAYENPIQSKWSNVLAVLKPSILRDLFVNYSLPSLVSVGYNPESGTCDDDQSTEFTSTLATSNYSYDEAIRLIGASRTLDFPSIYFY